MRFAQFTAPETQPAEPEGLAVFRESYPDVTFDAQFIAEYEDWKISVTAPVFPDKADDRKKAVFWWAGSRFLPEDKFSEKDDYWPLIYKYSREIKDPSSYTEEEIEAVRDFGSADSRMSQSGTPMFFYDFLYAAKSQIIIEDHIVSTKFLGKSTKIHERVLPALKRVEKQIQLAAETDQEIKTFVSSVKSADAYNWRIIGGTDRKSFHSYGIAIDILPKKLGGKAIFWNWEKERNPKNWMKVPLSQRWTPPAKVIDIFADEGFIWGGNWIIYDNMHFEYHPELFATSCR